MLARSGGGYLYWSSDQAGLLKGAMPFDRMAFGVY
jgi:hypothetical protein